MSYDLRAALGGHQISDEEFRALAAATQPLVRLGGEWRLLNDKEMRRAKQLAQLAVHGGGLPALTALGATLAGDADLRGFDVSVEAMAGGELATLAAQLRDGAMREPMQPADGFHGELRPYQLAGLGWLVRMRELGIGALLADDMGLGKTVQLIAYLLNESDEPSSPTLIVCPASVMGNWVRELHRFAPGLSVHLHHGPGPDAQRRRAARPRRRADVVLAASARPAPAVRDRVARRRAGRGAAGEEPAHARRPGRAAR